MFLHPNARGPRGARSIAAALVGVATVAGLLGQSASQDQSRPEFRTEANYVRVDVYATERSMEKSALVAVLMNTIMPRDKAGNPMASMEDLVGFVQIAHRFDLDPWAKEIYCIVSRGKVQPYVSIDGLRILQRLMKTQNARIGDIKVENLVDSSVVKKVDESGFFERLYAEYGVK